jgi:hypothetical protein
MVLKWLPGQNGREWRTWRPSCEAMHGGDCFALDRDGMAGTLLELQVLFKMSKPEAESAENVHIAFWIAPEMLTQRCDMKLL